MSDFNTTFSLLFWEKALQYAETPATENDNENEDEDEDSDSNSEPELKINRPKPEYNIEKEIWDLNIAGATSMELVFWQFKFTWEVTLEGLEEDAPKKCQKDAEFHPLRLLDRFEGRPFPEDGDTLLAELKEWLKPLVENCKVNPEIVKEFDLESRADIDWDAIEEVIDGANLRCDQLPCEWLSWWPAHRPSGVPKTWSFEHLSQKDGWIEYRGTWLKWKDIQEDIEKYDDEETKEITAECATLLRHGDMLDFNGYRGCGAWQVFGWDSKNLLLIKTELDYGYRTPSVMAWNLPPFYKTMQTGWKAVHKAFLPLLPQRCEMRRFWKKKASEEHDHLAIDTDNFDVEAEEGWGETPMGARAALWLICRRMNDVFARWIMVLQHTPLPRDVHKVIASFFIPQQPTELMEQFRDAQLRPTIEEALRYTLYGIEPAKK
eukprot:TRINITY_DN60794_c0_g1_i1.p2 TRINITY_DN60794_c0_g1~~TRINITY_DN60794_c0_g1_i1.p2  ORF type:complete len:434 (+),score=51.25 TRINITY_DN60794_c0_g1_i1:42-1343(+)